MKLIRDLIDALVWGRPGASSRIQGTNSTLITDTTVRTIIAAPATGFTNYIQSLVISNATASELPLISIKDGSTLLFNVQLDAALATGLPAAGCTKTFVFDPPLAVSGIFGANATTAVGDCTATAIGFTAPTTAPGNAV